MGLGPGQSWKEAQSRAEQSRGTRDACPPWPFPAVHSHCVGCSGTCPYVPPSQLAVGTPCTCIYTCACWAWLNTSAFGFTSFPLACLLSRNRVLSPPLPRPVPSSLLHLSGRTSNRKRRLCERRFSFFLLPTSSFLVRFQLLSCFCRVALVLAVHSFSLHTIVLTSAIRVVRPPNFPRFISTTFKPVAAVLSGPLPQYDLLAIICSNIVFSKPTLFAFFACSISISRSVLIDACDASDATLFEITNNIAIHLLDSNN